MKLRDLDDSCAGVTIPKDDLRALGYVDEDGDLIEQPNLNVKLVGDGKWEIQVLDENFDPFSD